MEEVSAHHKNTINKMNLEEMMALNSFLVGRIKAKRAVEAKRMKRQLFAGTKVSFEDNNGWTVHGKIIKVMRKFAQVRGPDRTVSVSYTHLTLPTTPYV